MYVCTIEVSLMEREKVCEKESERVKREMWKKFECGEKVEEGFLETKKSPLEALVS